MKRYTIQGILLGVIIGIAVGIGVYTFAYARGWSYLTDDPAACANCHVMTEQFDGWLKSSHRGGRDLQQLPHPGKLHRQVCDESVQRLLAFIFFHHGRLRGQYSNQTAQPGDHRASLSQLPRGDCRRHRAGTSGNGRRPTRLPALP